MHLKHWNRPGVTNRSIASTGRLPSVTWLIMLDFSLTRYLKRTLFNQYSRKYIKVIYELVGHVYSLVPLVMADYFASTRQVLSQQEVLVHKINVAAKSIKIGKTNRTVATKKSCNQLKLVVNQLLWQKNHKTVIKGHSP